MSLGLGETMRKTVTLAMAAVACSLAFAGGRMALIGDPGPAVGPGPSSSGEAADCGGGLRPASRLAAGPEISQRELGRALAAARGSNDPLLREIEALAGHTLTERLEPYRQAIDDVTPALESLEARGDSDRYAALAGSVIAVWHEMLSIYHESAPSPDLRRRLAVRYPAGLAGDLCRERRAPGSRMQVALAGG